MYQCFNEDSLLYNILNTASRVETSFIRSEHQTKEPLIGFFSKQMELIFQEQLGKD